jgi:hypothetical protein
MSFLPENIRVKTNTIVLIIASQLILVLTKFQSTVIFIKRLLSTRFYIFNLNIFYYNIPGDSNTTPTFFVLFRFHKIVNIAKLFIVPNFIKEIIIIFILSARRECFLCMKRSFTPRRRSRQYKPLNAQKHLCARNINNIFSIIDSKN